MVFLQFPPFEKRACIVNLAVGYHHDMEQAQPGCQSVKGSFQESSDRLGTQAGIGLVVLPIKIELQCHVSHTEFPMKVQSNCFGLMGFSLFTNYISMVVPSVLDLLVPPHSLCRALLLVLADACDDDAVVIPKEKQYHGCQGEDH